MPYAVWPDLAAPDAAGGDERAAAQLSDLMSDLITAGWEVTAPATDTEDDAPDESQDSPPDLLDVRVLAHPSGAPVVVSGLFDPGRDALPGLSGWVD